MVILILVFFFRASGNLGLFLTSQAGWIRGSGFLNLLMISRTNA